MKLRIGIVLAAVVAAVLPAPASADEPDTGTAVVEAEVAAEILQKGESTFWIVLDAEADLSPAYGLPWSERGDFVIDALQRTAATSQTGLLAELRARGHDPEPYWIVNAVRVTGDASTLAAVASRADVALVAADRLLSHPDPSPTTATPAPSSVEWGITSIGAPDVWSTYGARGESIVVASIDTGADYTHPAIARQYRGNLGSGTYDHSASWYDPTGACSAPCDTNGHGTHTIGTMIGDDGAGNAIGVAPGATWIAARGCETCSTSHLLASGQWVLAPGGSTSDRPHVVNNSWGGTGGDTWYLATVNAWRAAGIMPVFANGNSGPACGTAGDPADYAESYGVGAFDSSNAIASFSSRGPSAFGVSKPDISAPGVAIRSAIPGGSYQAWSGTSMASPHVAGAVALLWSAAPNLLGDVAATAALLDATATDVDDTSCGGSVTDNNVWGEGRLDISTAVATARSGPLGVLRGTVTDSASGAPVVGASVSASGPSSRSTTADTSGVFTFPALEAGTYGLTISAPAYTTSSVSGVSVTEAATTTADVALTLLPTHTVSGTVTTSAGEPAGGISVEVVGVATVTTSGDGSYSVSGIPEGAHTLRVTGNGCLTTVSKSLQVNADLTQDVSVAVASDSFGYTCTDTALPFPTTTDDLAFTGDDESTTVAIPFAFPFYGSTYTSASVCSNGFITFSGTACSLDAWSNQPVPGTAAPNAAVYAFWDDLVVAEGASLRTGSTADSFTIEWRNVFPYFTTSERLDIALTLFTDGRIAVVVQGMDGPRERGSSATIGIENADGTDGLQYSHATAAFTGSSDGLVFLPPASDTTAPVVTTPPDIVAEATGPSGAVVSFDDPTATDDTGVVSIGCDASSPATFPIGTTTVTCTALDASGNKGIGTFTVKVQDTTAPAITPMSDIAVLTSSASGTPVAWTDPAASDAVGVAAVACDRVSGSDFPIGSTTVTCTATDTAGNAGATAFTVTVEQAAAELGLVDVDQGIWNLDRESGRTSFYYGNPDDVPFAGDWDCDGVDTPGLFRTSDAFAYLRNTNTVGIADIRFFFGNPSDVPIAGDFDGDGCDTVSIYRPDEGRFYIINRLGENEGGLGAADFAFTFGDPFDIPIVGDWNGDGVDDVGILRPGSRTFFYRTDLSSGPASGGFVVGEPGDLVVAGDWLELDGSDTLGVYRPSSDSFLLWDTLGPGEPAVEVPGLGDRTRLPVAGAFG